MLNGLEGATARRALPVAIATALCLSVSACALVDGSAWLGGPVRVDQTEPDGDRTASGGPVADAPGGPPIDPTQESIVATAPPLPSSTPWPSPTPPPTSTPDPFTAAGRPIHLEIPSIGVDSYVETVGLTSDLAMDVPGEWDNVGWYNLGYRPGEVGNSVIAGHYDTNTGSPAVFWSLADLQAGDEVYVTYENGDRYTFAVEGSEFYDHDVEGPAIERIFGESLTPDLNLITCEGAWDRGRATYSHRLVVFTSLVPELTVRATRHDSTLE